MLQDLRAGADQDKKALERLKNVCLDDGAGVTAGSVSFKHVTFRRGRLLSCRGLEPSLCFILTADEEKSPHRLCNCSALGKKGGTRLPAVGLLVSLTLIL